MASNTHIRVLSNIDMKVPEIQENLLSLGVDIKKISCCIACNENFDQSTMHGELITCTNCKIISLASLIKTMLICQILHKSGDLDKVTNYTCFTDAVHSFLKVCTNSNNSVNCISKADLTKLFLKSGTVCVIADKSTRLIHQFLKSF